MSEQPSQLRLWDNAAQWDEWVRRSPQYSIFSTSRFLAALKVEVHRWVLYRAGEPQVAALVLTRNGQIIRAPHPFTMYQGIFYSGDAATMALHRRPRWELDVTADLLHQLSQHYDSLSFCLHPSITDVRGFQWFNYHDAEQGQFSVSLRYTGRVRAAELTDPQAFLGSIRDSRRRDHHKAVKAGLAVTPSTDAAILENLYGLTLARQGEELPESYRRLLRQITDAAIAGNFGELLVCRDVAGNPLSASLFLFDERCTYGLIGGNDPDARESGSGTMLLFECIRRGQIRGSEWIDLCGVNSPQRGDFKVSFNAEVQPYVEVRWARPYAYAALDRRDPA